VIDFRYHLVSIIAVFLALAVGIVVGTAALNGPIVDNLRDNINRLTSDKRTLEGDVRQLQAQVQASDEFATEIAPQLVDGVLADQRVLLVTTPETPGDLAERLRPLLTDAGATVTGQLEVLPALSDPQQRALIDDLVAQVVPAGVDLPEGEPIERAAAELAAALTTGPGNDPVDSGEAQAVVSAFEEADLVRFAPEAGTEGQALRTATLVVLLAPNGPQPPVDETVGQRNETMLALASAFDKRSAGLVVAGPASSAMEGGLVQALRSSTTLVTDISSVDNADRGIGRVAVVLALDAQEDDEVGQYGAGPGASDPLPALPAA
jgi:outer membrane murein-binding lipoprotein Lpp